MLMEIAIRSMLLDGVYGVVVSCHGKRECIEGKVKKLKRRKKRGDISRKGWHLEIASCLLSESSWSTCLNPFSTCAPNGQHHLQAQFRNPLPLHAPKDLSTNAHTCNHLSQSSPLFNNSLQNLQNRVIIICFERSSSRIQTSTYRTTCWFLFFPLENKKTMRACIYNHVEITKTRRKLKEKHPCNHVQYQGSKHAQQTWKKA